MSDLRYCCRPGCRQNAIATLTYVYSDSIAVLGPLAHESEPHTWDLCLNHAARLSAPKGWELVRSDISFREHPGHDDDLIALAEAVRERARPPLNISSSALASDEHQPILLQQPVKNSARRGHLRVLPDPK